MSHIQLKNECKWEILIICFYFLQMLCKAMGILLHFFLAGLFSWALVEGWHLYALLLQIFTEKKKCFRKRYYILGYGTFKSTTIRLYIKRKAILFLTTRCFFLKILSFSPHHSFLVHELLFENVCYSNLCFVARS